MTQSALRFEGGPLDGQTKLTDNPWPHPDLLTELEVPGLGADGAYRKDPERESKLTDEQLAEMPVLARGVVYVWGDICRKCLATGWHATGTVPELFGGGYVLVPCDCGAEMSFPMARGMAYAALRESRNEFSEEGPERVASPVQ